MSFCGVTDCHLGWNPKSFQGRVHCQLFCQTHCSILDAMSDGNVSQWCVTGCHRWSGWINFSFFFASSGIWSPAMARHVSPQSGPCCSRSNEGGQQIQFLSWSISPVSFWTTYMETCCFMLFLLLYGIQLVDWAFRIKFTTVPVWLFLYCICLCLSILFSHGPSMTLWVRPSPQPLNDSPQECFMASKMVESGLKSCSGWRFLGKTFLHCKFCRSKLLLDWAYTMMIYK